MEHPVKGNKTYTLFNAIVAAKLNKFNGCNTPCEVKEAIIEANNLIEPYSEKFKDGCITNGRTLEANSLDWQGCGKGEDLYEILDAYNNNCYSCSC
ncbi:hypothetical protein EO95_14085 [Methanosarcina sp. 1.H.T.1A.1]|uniref:hypothetical protein n=1 Tax=Methanosarcina sp. 1.H.T.1A.1 TaxID=1483602 RepID=UPI0006215B18|nr:hypothetical protein [Methanosarcina sp. 1.H.T.1A.1]KKI00398.1 hypothetical protein EO95_14085 [Methanosarcina sp. 1.H.T.1A.1]